ncbi:MAG: SDR family oxidoreductase [Chloroflexota bacterium]
MRVLVTGGAGFLGGHVATELAEAGNDVIIFDQAESTLFPTRRGDLLDADSVKAAVRGMDAVCHLGAVGDVYLAFERPALAAAVNAVGTANVLDAAHHAGSTKVVYASTWEVYGEPEYSPLDEQHPTRPDHPYNITKLAGEHLVLSYDRLKDVPGVALRVGTAYGTGMRPNSVFSIFIRKAANREPIVIHGSGSQSRQFTHATDIGKAFALAIEPDVRGEVFNIVANEAQTIRELAEAIGRSLPTEISFGEARVGDVPSATVSNAKARQVLGWEPSMLFQEGLNQLIEWQVQNIHHRGESTPR